MYTSQHIDCYPLGENQKIMKTIGEIRKGSSKKDLKDDIEQLNTYLDPVKYLVLYSSQKDKEETCRLGKTIKLDSNKK